MTVLTARRRYLLEAARQGRVWISDEGWFYLDRDVKIGSPEFDPLIRAGLVPKPTWPTVSRFRRVVVEPVPEHAAQLDEIETVVATLDPELDRADDAFKVAVVLLAALVVGADAMKVAELTGYEPEFVQALAARLETSGVWADGTTHCDWFGEDGGVEFWLHVAVAQGYLEMSSSLVDVTNE